MQRSVMLCTGWVETIKSAMSCLLRMRERLTQRFTYVCLDDNWRHLGLDSGVVDDPSFSGDFLRDRLLNFFDLLGLLDSADGGVLEEDDNHDLKRQLVRHS